MQLITSQLTLTLFTLSSKRVRFLPHLPYHVGYSFQFPDTDSEMLCSLMPETANYKAVRLGSNSSSSLYELCELELCYLETETTDILKVYVANSCANYDLYVANSCGEFQVLTLLDLLVAFDKVDHFHLNRIPSHGYLNITLTSHYNCRFYKSFLSFISCYFIYFKVLLHNSGIICTLIVNS